MSFLRQIQNKRDEYNEKAKVINQMLAENGDKWTTELQNKHNVIADEMELLQQQIQSMENAEKKRINETFEDVDQFKVDNKNKKEGISPAKQALNVFLRKKINEYTADEAMLVRNVMSTTTGSEGGFTVQSEIASTLIDSIKAFRFMRGLASQITTEKGNPLSYPTSDGTAEIGEIVAENGTATALDPTFGTVGVNVWKYSSKSFAVPIELLQDAQIDVEALVLNRAAQRIGRATNQHFTTGTGTGQPSGVIARAAVGKTGATGQTTTILYADLVDLIDSVDIGYQQASGQMTFMMSQVMRRVLRKLTDTAGRPIWSPSYEAGIAGSFSDFLLGYPVAINNDMASPAANAKTLAFGDMSKYLIRDAMEVSFFRFEDSAYITKGQIGFLAWARSGGNLLDTAAVKVYQHSAT